MMQNKVPDDFVIATGKSTSVRKFVEISFNLIGVKIKWQGKGLKEVGLNKKTGNKLIKIDKRLVRPNEVHFLKGNSQKARRVLKWKPNKIRSIN